MVKIPFSGHGCSILQVDALKLHTKRQSLSSEEKVYCQLELCFFENQDAVLVATSGKIEIVKWRAARDSFRSFLWTTSWKRSCFFSRYMVSHFALPVIVKKR